MALENATYVGQLDSNNPFNNDAISQSDDHSRLVKRTLLASFPRILGEVAATQAELNSLVGALGLTGDDLNLLAGASPGVTPGDIEHLAGTTGNLQVQINNLSGATGSLLSGISWNRYSNKDITSGAVKVHTSSTSKQMFGFNLNLWNTDFANKVVEFSMKLDGSGTEVLPTAWRTHFLTDGNGNAMVLEQADSITANTSGNATASVKVTGTSLTVFYAECPVIIQV